MEVPLTTTEFNLLCLLVYHKGQVLTYPQIYENVWGDPSNENEREAISYHVRNLRKKLYNGKSPSDFVIENIKEVGYRLEILSK